MDNVLDDLPIGSYVIPIGKSTEKVNGYIWKAYQIIEPKFIDEGE